MLLVVVVQILHVLRVEAVLLVVVKGGWLLVEARADPHFCSSCCVLFIKSLLTVLDALALAGQMLLKVH